uniref:Uncharacterized protein n=1 Tax=Rhizophora mucronata TaxID=61149 RepID=A0A2P2LQN6_RHIMU
MTAIHPTRFRRDLPEMLSVNAST